MVGHAATIAAGEWVTASGEWINDRTHGQQFKARFMRTSAPTSIDGIEKYLGSGMIRGIGPVYARKMVKAFGEKVFDIIEAEPDRLREVTGIGRVRAKRITDAWAEQKIVREIMVFLHSHTRGATADRDGGPRPARGHAALLARGAQPPPRPCSLGTSDDRAVWHVRPGSRPGRDGRLPALAGLRGPRTRPRGRVSSAT
ncbi:Helicase RecD/TraA [alpha proteobacterium BAL199]|nr:Helicase RecD/TraA [alpha proteobacterium BAL199]